MTPTIDVDLPTQVFGRPCERPNATLALTEFGNVFTAANDADFVRNQSSVFRTFRQAEPSNGYLVYDLSPTAPRKYVVIQSDPLTPERLSENTYGSNFHGMEIVEDHGYSFWQHDQLKPRTSVFPSVCINETEDEEVLGGINPINQQYKILHTQQAEIRTASLKRWQPTISIIDAFFEDDE